MTSHPTVYARDPFGDPRDYSAEAQAILAGELPLSPMLQHCHALLHDIWTREEAA